MSNSLIARSWHKQRVTDRANARPRIKATLPAQHAATVAAACRQIENAETLPALGELASVAGLSGFHFHLVLKPSPA